MVRIVYVLLAGAALVVLAPAAVSAQRAGELAPQTHTVVEGETLWGLARRFYGDSGLWRRIMEANAEVVRGPQSLEPGTVLVIPDSASPGAPPLRTDTATGGVPARIGTIAVQRGGAGDGSSAVERRADPTEALPPGLFAAAPFVLDATSETAVDSIIGPAAPDPMRSMLHSARRGERLVVTSTGAPPAVGTRLQAYREGRALPRRRRLATPTGVLRVEAVDDGRIVATVIDQIDRMTTGDRIRPLPAPAASAPAASGALEVAPATSNLEVVILAAAREQPMLGPGDWVILTGGSAAGVRPGDEFVPSWVSDAVHPGGRLQVVRVQDATATARIVAVGEALLEPGRTVRLDRRLR